MLTALWNFITGNRLQKGEKIVLITGGANGIGASVAEHLLRQGDSVIICDMDEVALDERERQLQELKMTLNLRGSVYKLAMNVTNEEGLLSNKEELERRGIQLDAIINFAGIMASGPFMEMDIDRLQRVVNVNVMGTARVNKVFFPLLRNAGDYFPRIINVGSEVSLYQVWSGFSGAYSMTKIAIEAYSSALRQELSLLPKPVYVSVLNPGALRTAMTKMFLEDGPGSFQHVAEQNPKSRWYLNLIRSHPRAKQYIQSHVAEPSIAGKAIFDMVHRRRPGRNYAVNASWEFFVLYYFVPRWLFENIFYYTAKV